MIEERNDAPIWAVLVAVAVIAVSAGTPAASNESTPEVSPEIRTRPQRSPSVDIPHRWRTYNWAPYGEGSCVHASMYMLLRWQDQHEMAEWWKANYHSGDHPQGLERKMESVGLRFAETREGDLKFLEWAIRTRRGCCVTIMGGAHMVCLVGLDAQNAYILDNNDPHNVQTWTRQGFLNEWRNSYWQWAVTPVYDPPPSRPWY